MAPAVATYDPRDPSDTVLYRAIAEHLETFLDSLDPDPEATGLPAFVRREFYAYLRCGILATGLGRMGYDPCHHELLLPFSCKRRGFCPSCAARRMAQTAAHLVEQAIPWVPTRPWVVSVPIPLRYWMASSRDLMPQVHGIIRNTISQYYVNPAVKRGAERCNLQAGSVTFVQHFGGSLNLNLHFHAIVMEGVFVDRSEQGRKPRFLQAEPPSDAEVAEVADLEDPVATEYDPLRDREPVLAHTMAASVQRCIAFGERAGQRVRRIGSGFGNEGERPALTGTRCASVNGFSVHANTHIPAHRRNKLEQLLRYTGRGPVALVRLSEDADGNLVYRFNRPWSDGTTGITLTPLELLEKLTALVPVPGVHLVRYSECLAPHSKATRGDPSHPAPTGSRGR